MKISVVLCTFNGERFLEEQLTSIAQQTRVPDELVICDDRSTDSTVDIAHDICRRYELNGVIEVNKERLGVEENFSYAMGKATGDVLFFCDQDDVWVVDKVEKMIAPFQDDPQVTLVYSDGWITGPNLEQTKYTLFNKNPRKHLLDGDTRPIGTLLKQGNAPGIKASSMAFGSRVRELAGPLPDGVAHDSWLAFFGYVAGKVVAVPEQLYSYRRHEHTSGKSSTNKLISGLEHVKKVESQVAQLQEKTILAHRIFERLCEIEDTGLAGQNVPSRFAALLQDAEDAARTLGARAMIHEQSGVFSRMLQGMFCLIQGDYVAIEGFIPKLKILRHDVLQR
ncbi:hypothetical protein CSA56_00040 [candidate division KSB3 bacterium]|uniref:Glycosyltransferase 2-like domain-containing protein n=1 Tax=candidate division KSB3 bacterium TaxID=2044937 RepID=A0A2G6KLN6_9BACT|nr:MAG: hypothetical protein CSA56_00040 [candidate division KSB3 bacterium]